MSAIDVLGRSVDVIPIAAGAGISMKNCAGILFVCTSAGADTATLTVATSFAGSYSAPASLLPFTRKYTASTNTGTAAWARANFAATNAVVLAAGTTAFYLDSNSLPDTFTYAKVSTGGALVMAVLGDLQVQRKPENLAIKGA